MGSDSLDDKIAQLSHSRAVLAVLIGKIDRELISLKTKRNAVSPLYRMPAEVLIEIFKLVQLNNCASNGWFSRLDLPSRDWKRIVPEHEWTQILAVSSHIRAVVVAAPELWAYFCSSWPLKWREVYIQRSRNLPLRIACHITNKTRADGTRDGLLCMPRYAASHAVLDFHQAGGASGWSEDHNAVLRWTQSDSLQFLTIQSHRGPMAELSLWPGDLSGFGQLSHLNIDLTRGVRVEDAFSFPGTLRALRLVEVIISYSPDRLRALLGGLPHLEYLEIGSVTRARGTAPPDSPIRVPPLNLSLHTLLMKSCHFDLLHAFVQLIPIPRHVLHIDCAVHLSTFWLASATRYAIAQDLRDYAQRFWSSRMGRSTLPPATLHIMSGERSHRKSWMEMQAVDKWDERSLLNLILHCHPVAADDILLPYVTNVHLNRRGVATTLMEDMWTTFCDLPALQNLHINCPRAWETVDDVKMWADAHSRRPFAVHYSSFLVDENDENPDLKLIWESSDVPLKETAWSAFMAAEHALQQPDSDGEEDW